MIPSQQFQYYVGSEQESTMKQASSLLGLLFELENGGNMFV
jgi:hypothetical protein